MEHKGGIIPIDGRLGKIHNRHILLAGDAAGLCGAVTGGGIFQAVVSGQLAAKAVIEFLNGDVRALNRLQTRLMRFYHLRSLLLLERRLRRILDGFTLNGSIQWLFDQFRDSQRYSLLRRGLLETPFQAMGSLWRDFLLNLLFHPLPPRELVSGVKWFYLEGLSRLSN